MEERREEFKGFNGEAFIGSDAGRSHVCGNPNCSWSPKIIVHGIEAERIAEGWVFRHGGRESGPHPDIIGLNDDLLAEDLGVEKKDAAAVRLKAEEMEVTRPLTVEELSDILGLTVKRDVENKIITFLCMLAAYTEEDQFNVSFRAESSTGKSYIPLELAQLFPPEDIVKFAYSSPTSFYHDEGEYDRETGIKTIDLERKILIFLDQPHDMLLERLRPLLSHDEKELIYKITDKREKFGLRTKTIKIRGFPSVIFCTAKLRVEDQEATRMILLSPEISQEKIRESIYLRTKRDADRRAFKDYVERDPRRKALKARIKEIRQMGIMQVRLPNPDKIAERFLSTHPILKPRHTRDITRILSFAKSLALLNAWHRKRDGDTIEASQEDIDVAFKLYEEISEAQELGISPHVLMIYREVIVPLYRQRNSQGISRKDVAREYLNKFGRPISDWLLRREILPSLEEAGLITQEPDPSDRRRMLIYVVEEPTTPPSSPLYSNQRSPEKYSGQHGGVSAGDIQLGVCELCGESRPIRKAFMTALGREVMACEKCIAGSSRGGYTAGHGHDDGRSPETTSDSQKKPGGLAAAEAAKDSNPFSEKSEAEAGEISRLWPWPRNEEDVMRIWRPGPGPCEDCGEYASERYPVKVAGGWTRFLCRKCAGEVEA